MATKRVSFNRHPTNTVRAKKRLSSSFMSLIFCDYLSFCCANPTKFNQAKKLFSSARSAAVGKPFKYKATPVKYSIRGFERQVQDDNKDYGLIEVPSCCLGLVLTSNTLSRKGNTLDYFLHFPGDLAREVLFLLSEGKLTLAGSGLTLSRVDFKKFTNQVPGRQLDWAIKKDHKEFQAKVEGLKLDDITSFCEESGSTTYVGCRTGQIFGRMCSWIEKNSDEYYELQIWRCAPILRVLNEFLHKSDLVSFSDAGKVAYRDNVLRLPQQTKLVQRLIGDPVIVRERLIPPKQKLLRPRLQPVLPKLVLPSYFRVWDYANRYKIPIGRQLLLYTFGVNASSPDKGLTLTSTELAILWGIYFLAVRTSGKCSYDFFAERSSDPNTYSFSVQVGVLVDFLGLERRTESYTYIIKSCQYLEPRGVSDVLFECTLGRGSTTELHFECTNSFFEPHAVVGSRALKTPLLLALKKNGTGSTPLTARRKQIAFFMDQYFVSGLCKQLKEQGLFPFHIILNMFQEICALGHGTLLRDHTLHEGHRHMHPSRTYQALANYKGIHYRSFAPYDHVVGLHAAEQVAYRFYVDEADLSLPRKDLRDRLSSSIRLNHALSRLVAVRAGEGVLDLRLNASLNVSALNNSLFPLLTEFLNRVFNKNSQAVRLFSCLGKEDRYEKVECHAEPSSLDAWSKQLTDDVSGGRILLCPYSRREQCNLEQPLDCGFFDPRLFHS